MGSWDSIYQTARLRKRWGDPVARFWQKVLKGPGCWLWQNATWPNGYGCVRHFDTKRMTGAHRVAWELTHGPIPDGLNVLHDCDNPPCVNPEHLFLGTQVDNSKDMDAKGRRNNGVRDQRGEKNNGRKLTEATAQTVLDLYAAGCAQADIMRSTGVTRANVWAIVHRKSWVHLHALA